ncbi:MAG TPA: ATPase, partial [Mycobacterium sp.]|nr:ATPase [Mycobacterium sp.]
MADKGVARGRPGAARQRIKTLTQAALNADVTVEQVDTLLTELGET